MAEAVEMPKLSDTMEEGVLVGWQAEEGDEVEMGQVIAQVETDKATMDLEAYEDGVLLKRVIAEGESVPIGQLIAVIGEEGEDISDLVSGNGEADTAEAKESEEAETEDEEDVDTQPAASDDDTDAEDDDAPNEDEETQGAASQDGETADAAEGEPSGNGRLRASPLARRMASENELELGSIEGSGPQGRVVKRDVEAVLSGEKEAAPAEAEEATEPQPAAPPSGDGFQRPAEVMPAEEDLYQSEDISQMRKAIARRLGQSKFGAPHFYLTVDIDMAKAVDFRRELNELAEQQERPRISINDLITKACAQALNEHPYVNGSYLEEEGELRLYNEVHVGVAVAIDEGLVTPVIRHADRKGIAQIAGETREKAERARSRDLAPDEMEGSTFTTSNLGMFGIEAFTAIINPPNACILAIGEVREEPVVQDGEVVAGTRMKVTLSCDHRIVDGATGAQFLATVRDYLEEPMSLML